MISQTCPQRGSYSASDKVNLWQWKITWNVSIFTHVNTKNSMALAHERTIPSYCCLSAKLVPTFGDRGCCVISTADSYGHILGFLDRSRYLSFQISAQLYSRGWVDPVPDPLLLRKSGSEGHRTRTFGSAARNPDHYTTEVAQNVYHI
jgi:hypothetical protein